MSASESRRQRRLLAKAANKHNARRPATLTHVPSEEWPANQSRNLVGVWVSRRYLVQLFDEIGSFRMSVNRVERKASGWADRMTWDELQQIKHDIGFGDWTGFEVYPRDCDVVNVANMRHIWLMPDPPEGIGWRNDNESE